MNASRARELTAAHAHMIEEVAEARMGDIFARIERAAVAGQNMTVVTLPDGFEQGAIEVLKSRDFRVNNIGDTYGATITHWNGGNSKVLVRW